MDSNYEKLLERSVATQEGINDSLRQLKENTKALNDSFVLHCAGQDDIQKEVKIIRLELLKWLKWSIVILISVLGGKQIITLLIDKI
jgi:hypothetical protein